MGGTMRLGAQDVVLRPSSLASFLNEDRTIIRERFRHRYEVDPQFIATMEESGLVFSGRHPEHPIMQVPSCLATGTPTSSRSATRS